MNRRDGHDSRMLSRRHLLSLSAVGAAGLAGCGGTNARNADENATDDRSTGGSTEASTSGGTGNTASLGYVRVSNRHDATHTMHVLVERDGEVVFWSSYELGTESNRATKSVDGPWTTDQANYTVHFRTDEREEWRTFSTAKTDLSCYGLEGKVDADGKLGIWVEYTPDSCETTTTTTRA